MKLLINLEIACRQHAAGPPLYPPCETFPPDRTVHKQGYSVLREV
jgi:hypothetical protein